MDRELTLRLVSLPPEVTASQLDYAAPLGTRQAVAERITELLPGTTFAVAGVGTFRRANYHITFILADAEPTAVEVSIDRVEGLVALRRLLEKTGWQVVDPSAGCFVDIDASRAAGLVVPVAARSAPVAEVEHAPGRPWRRHAWHGLLAVALAASLWVAWEWSRRVPGIPRPSVADAAASPLTNLVGAVSAARASATPGGSAGAGVSIAAIREQLTSGPDRLRRRMLYVKYFAPEFREDSIVQQILEYQMAAAMFPGSLGENGFVPPERLTDPALFAPVNGAPPLPRLFARPQRDGYDFQFDGRDCTRQPKYLPAAGPLCAGFVYSARPLAGVGRSYAYFSSDDRIHYRADAAPPTRDDPTVDNTAPSTAADLPGPSQAADGQTDSRVKAAVDKAIDSMVRAAGFGSVSEADAAFHEENAMNDLRQVAAAERVFFAMTMRGYASPERLGEAKNYAGVQLQPLLPGYFVQPMRQGYKFEFVGTTPMPGRGSDPFAALGDTFQEYVYLAIPQDPGPPRRRSLALYPDAIFATAERRAPTRKDTAIGLR